MKKWILIFFGIALCAMTFEVHSQKNDQTANVSIPAGFSEHAESHNLKAFSMATQNGKVILKDAHGNNMFRCISNDNFTPDNVQIDSERGLILQGTVTGEGPAGSQVPRERQQSGGVMSGKHFGDAFSYWSFVPKPPSNRIRVDIYATIPRPLGAKTGIWSFADDWYSGGGSLISLEMDMIEAGGRPDQYVDSTREGMFRYHPNLHSWFGGGSPWKHASIQHTEAKNLYFGTEDTEHKMSIEWINGPSLKEKKLRYLIDDKVVYERSIADLKKQHPKLERGEKTVESTMNAQEIAEFMWDKPQNLQLWYGADQDFWLSGTPQYGDDWPSEMIIRRIDVFR